MTATLTRPRPPASSNGHQPPAPPARKTTRINRTRAGLGVLVIALSIVAVLTLYSSADDRTQVLALRARVPAGQAITQSDLTTVEVPADSTLAIVAADQASSVVGQVALSTLEPGMLLAPSLVAAQPLVPTGTSVIGATLKPGQYPVGLRVGDTVRVVETPVATSTQATPAIDRGTARIVDLAEAQAGVTGIAVSLLVGDDATVALSSAGAAGRLSLAVVAS
jgi:hypothetical protein